MDKKIIAARLQEINEGLCRQTGSITETHFRKSKRIGAAARISGLIKGQDVITNLDCLRAAAGELGITSDTLDNALSDLEAIGYASVHRSGGEVSKVEERVPLLEQEFSALGELWLDRHPSDIERATIQMIDQLMITPQRERRLVERLAEKDLATLLSGLDVLEKPHVEVEQQLYQERANVLEQQKAEMRHVLDYLRYDFWTMPENRNIVNLLRIAKRTSTQVRPDSSAHLDLLHQIAVHLSLAVLQLSGQVVRHSIRDVKDGCLTRLLGGPRERRDREALYDTLAKAIPGKGLNITPEFHPALAELVARFINATAAAANVVRCLDHLARRILLPSFDSVYGDPSQTYGMRTLKLSRDVLHFIISETGVREEMYEVSLKDADAGSR